MSHFTKLREKRMFHALVSSCRNMRTMKAWQTMKYGGPEHLESASVRVPILTDPLHVLVKVHAASINPLDIRMLEGYGASLFNVMRETKEAFPLIPGRDFSGTVANVGNAVKGIKCGDEVWGVTNPFENGSHAEYVLTQRYYISAKPKTIGHVEAASVPYAALTAWSALVKFGGLSEGSLHGKRILVTGASGGIGTFVVQLLKLWGAEVYVTCSTDAVETMQKLFVDGIFDYHHPEFNSDLQRLQGLDFIFDNVGGDYPGLTFHLLKKWQNSKYVTVVSPLLKNTDDHGMLFGTFLSVVQATCDTIMSAKDGRSFRWAYFIPDGSALNKIAKMFDKHELFPYVDEVFQFDAVPDAYRRVLKGHARGKTVIDILGTNNENYNVTTKTASMENS